MVSGSVLHQTSAAATRDEATLVAEARAGDREAQNTLIAGYVRDVYEVAFHALRDKDMAQDATQDAFVNALKGLHRFRGEASFRTWLLRIALNSARTIGRRRSRRREVGLTLVENHAEDRGDLMGEVAVRDEAGRIAALVAHLPAKQRLAVGLRVNQGLSYHEIGAVLHCSEGAARVNYHLGIKRLREWMR